MKRSQNHKINIQINSRSFQRLAISTIGVIYFLILIGGTVRTTGAGMGCPDWPKCFGQLIPPTSVDQLPEDYKEVFAEQRARKNDRLVSYLTFLGFDNKASEIKNDPDILVEADFNATKTWIEYINRLVGAGTGLFVLALAIRSLQFYRIKKRITFFSTLTLFLILIQAWIGALVVSTNLMPWMITVHMLLAVVIVNLVIYVYYHSTLINHTRSVLEDKSVFTSVLIISMVLMVFQIVFGTQVREEIDVLNKNGLLRVDWIENLSLGFLIHRSLSLLILATHIVMLVLMFKISQYEAEFKSILIFALVLVIAEIITGVIMAYFAVPAWAQPVHLLVGVMIIGVQFYAYISALNSEKITSKKMQKI
ncbi:MAG: COX15/CtaA family protein [Cyclobacteriaceae bacterium]|nr:COX15/CtaA family protein [Cyclobacteriaceae bacterium]MCH8515171.1 COX15/CtaA family protein [Cyclobacteriaceae bacterium]